MRASSKVLGSEKMTSSVRIIDSGSVRIYSSFRVNDCKVATSYAALRS